MQGSFKAPPFQNVGAGQTANLPNLPTGLIYDGLVLKLGGTFTKAQIDEIRIRLGGKTILEMTGSELDTINQYMARVENASYLPIWFADPNARGVVGENQGAIDTRNVQYDAFSIEADINSGTTSPTLECWIIPGRPKLADFVGMFRAYTKAVQSISASGVHNLTPALASGALLNRLHVFHTNITRLDVKQAGFELQGDGENGIVQFVQNELRRETQSGHLAFDPTVRDNQADAMPLFRQDGSRVPTEFKATLSGADTVELISEMYTTHAGL